MVSMLTKILYGHLIIVLPILLAYYSSSRTTEGFSKVDFSQVLEIDISKILAQNLRLAQTTRDHAILTLALLEVQNPELTVFAGAGYGVHLRHPNPGAVIEAFPNGKLPQAGGSRYDPWTKVKGLRYAATLIVTNGTAGPETPLKEGKKDGAQDRIRDRTGRVSEEKGKMKVGGWLIHQKGDTSAVDATGFGWATLLLERAGAIDIDNPVGQGRSPYGEAADGMIEWLFDEAKNARYVLEELSREDDRQVGEAEQGSTQTTRWAISYTYEEPQMRAETIFLTIPFLSAYAVARRDARWLLEAVEQTEMHIEVLTHPPGHEQGLWKGGNGYYQSSRNQGQNISNALFSSAWMLGGIVRVLAVMERWQREDSGEITSEISLGKTRLTQFSKQTIQHLKNSPHLLCDSLLTTTSKQIVSNLTQACTSGKFADVGSTALLVSSVYRLGQLHLLSDQTVLDWADELYGMVARQTAAKARPSLISVSGEISQPDTNFWKQSESQSMVLVMYAARRDCVKLKICRPTHVEDWRGWPLSIFM